MSKSDRTGTQTLDFHFEKGRTALITGGAVRIGAMITEALASEGVNVIIHHSRSQREAEELAKKCAGKGVKAELFRCDFSTPEITEAQTRLLFSQKQVDYLINNAAIFKSIGLERTSLAEWQKHININLTAPFLLSKYFSLDRSQENPGKIINIVDWRALRPGADHFPYTITKAALASMTKSLAAGLAPYIQVNAVAFGAILAPTDGTKAEKFLMHVPAKRLAYPEEVIRTIFFLLAGPEYITGEIIHLDGGRHLF